MRTERFLFFLTTFLLAVALILTNLKTQKLIVISEFDYVVGNKDLEIESYVEPDFWTDIAFEELLKEGCQQVQRIYRSKLSHDKGYHLAYRKGWPLRRSHYIDGAGLTFESLLVHSNASEVERLIRALYRPYYTFTIHVDNKVSTHFSTIPNLLQATSNATFEILEKYSRCFKNIFMVKNRVSIHYAGYSRLQADINAMQELLDANTKWKHLCGYSCLRANKIRRSCR